VRGHDREVIGKRPETAAFVAGRLTNFRVLIDTFELVEQTVGYPINLPRMAV